MIRGFFVYIYSSRNLRGVGVGMGNFGVSGSMGQGKGEQSWVVRGVCRVA